MKRLGVKLLVTLSLLFIFLGAGSSEVSANRTYEVNVEFRLYTDAADVNRDISKGGFKSTYSSITVKENEVWSGDYFVANKLQKLGEEALQKQYGSNVAVSDLIMSNNRIEGSIFRYGTYIDSDSYMIQNNTNKKNLQLTFPRFSTFERKIVVNLFGSFNGPLNGWKAYSGDHRYYNNNEYLTGLNKVGQTTYLFNSNGAKQFGWHNVNGWQMYFNPENGGLWTGKRKIGHTTYLFNSQGHKIDGWHRLDGKDYYFNQQNGGMWTGKRKIGHTTYLFHNEGHKIYGWYVNSYNQKSYFDPAYGGGMVTGFRKVGNAYYYFDTVTGNARTHYSRNINGQRWYFNSNGIGSIER